MCKDCGCDRPGEVAIDGVPAEMNGEHPVEDPGHPHDHPHPHPPDHDHGHPHPSPHGMRRTVPVDQGSLQRNDRLAERNRGFFQAKGLTVLNVLASPGAGKTAFLERTAADVGPRFRLGVIVGDQATEHDAARLREHGVPAVQITTGSLCYLDAEMVARAMGHLDLDALDLLFIENVGNLVCPAVCDLGEHARVVLLSVTEGEDKPLKYPVIFQHTQVVVINKMDLAAAVGFDREVAVRNIRCVAPEATVFEVSAKTAQGMDGWYEFLARTVRR